MMMIGFGFLVLLLLGGLVVALLVGGGKLLGQTGTAGSSSGMQQPTARQVLDARLARGEISTEEYEEIRARIRQ
ncbi:MAG: SHOCT domain-containing protein [Anaerolineae bacterium]|jgi:uncharacterized membrane protein